MFLNFAVCFLTSCWHDLAGVCCSTEIEGLHAKHAPPEFFNPGVSSKQAFLLFDAQARGDAFQHHACRDLAKLFGLDLVKAAAVDAAFRDDFRRPDSF